MSRLQRNARATMPSFNDDEKESEFGIIFSISGPGMFFCLMKSDNQFTLQ